MAPEVVGLPTLNPDPNEDMVLVSLDPVRQGVSDQVIPKHPENLVFLIVPVFYADQG